MRWIEARTSRIMSGVIAKGCGQEFPHLNQLNETGRESCTAGCDGLVFLPYMSGERSPIWDPIRKRGISTDWTFQ